MVEVIKAIVSYGYSWRDLEQVRSQKAKEREPLNSALCYGRFRLISGIIHRHRQLAQIIMIESL